MLQGVLSETSKDEMDELTGLSPGKVDGELGADTDITGDVKTRGKRVHTN